MKKTPQHHVWHHSILVFAALMVLLLAACGPQTAPTQTAPIQKTAVSAESNNENPQTQTEQSPENEEMDCSYQERTVNGAYQYRAPCNNGYYLIFSSSRLGPLYLALIKATDEWTTLEITASNIALYGDNEADLKIMHEQICYYLKGDESKDIPARAVWTQGGEMTSYLHKNPCK